MNLTIYYPVLIILCCSIVKSQETCQTPLNEPGSCIPIHYCMPIVELIQRSSKPLPAFVLDFLWKSVCDLRDGLQHICCSNRHTTTSATTPTTTTTRATTRRISTTTNNITNRSSTATPDVPHLGKIEDISNHPNLNLLPTTCGIIAGDRISHGENTTINEFPFMALLGYNNTLGSIHFRCAGTIISQRYILTAAHCILRGSRYKLVSVRVGEHVISTPRDCETVFGREYCAPAVDDIDIEEMHFYPRYNRPPFANDVAVIRLSRNINLNNSNMHAICLPINNGTQYQSLVNVTTAGWGTTETNQGSDILLQASLPIVNPVRCQQQYGSTRILESHICAGGVSQIDTCHGDSGGPVFYTGRVHNSIRYVQYGIVAVGHRSCGGNGDIPGVYTRISYYMKWILDNIRA